MPAGEVAVRIILLVVLGCWLHPALADLYRWVEPETGSIKFSSYPPPWYGDPARQRRAPKVEVIPARGSAPAPGPVPREEPRSDAKPNAAARTVDIAPDRPAARPKPDPLKRESGPAARE